MGAGHSSTTHGITGWPRRISDGQGVAMEQPANNKIFLRQQNCEATTRDPLKLPGRSCGVENGPSRLWRFHDACTTKRSGWSFEKGGIKPARSRKQGKVGLSVSRGTRPAHSLRLLSQAADWDEPRCHKRDGSLYRSFESEANALPRQERWRAVPERAGRRIPRTQHSCQSCGLSPANVIALPQTAVTCRKVMGVTSSQNSSSRTCARGWLHDGPEKRRPLWRA